MIQAKQELLTALRLAIEQVSPDALASGTVTAAFELPKQASHGDLACTVAMPLAKDNFV